MEEMRQNLLESFNDPKTNFVKIGVYNALYKTYRIEAFKIKETGPKLLIDVELTSTNLVPLKICKM